jgi:hypothetical protein
VVLWEASAGVLVEQLALQGLCAVEAGRRGAGGVRDGRGAVLDAVRWLDTPACAPVPRLQLPHAAADAATAVAAAAAGSDGGRGWGCPGRHRWRGRQGGRRLVTARHDLVVAGLLVAEAVELLIARLRELAVQHTRAGKCVGRRGQLAQRRHLRGVLAPAVAAHLSRAAGRAVADGGCRVGGADAAFGLGKEGLSEVVLLAQAARRARFRRLGRRWRAWRAVLVPVVPGLNAREAIAALRPIGHAGQTAFAAASPSPLQPRRCGDRAG